MCIYDKFSRCWPPDPPSYLGVFQTPCYDPSQNLMLNPPLTNRCIIYIMWCSADLLKKLNNHITSKYSQNVGDALEYFAFIDNVVKSAKKLYNWELTPLNDQLNNWTQRTTPVKSWNRAQSILILAENSEMNLAGT